MTKENPPSVSREKELALADFVQALQGLSDKTNPVPIEVATVEAAAPFLGGYLQEKGLMLGQLEQTEHLHSLIASKMRRLDSGKWPAIVVALDGVEILEQLINLDSNLTPEERNQKLEKVLRNSKTGVYRTWTQSLSAEMPALKNGGDASRRRGLEQLLGITIALAEGLCTPQDYVKQLNWRIASREEKRAVKKIDKTKGVKPKDEQALAAYRQELMTIRKKYGIPSPEDKSERKAYRGVSSFPPGSPILFWEFIKELASTSPDQLPELMSRLPQVDRITLLGNDAVPFKKGDDDDNDEP